MSVVLFSDEVLAPSILIFHCLVDKPAVSAVGRSSCALLVMLVSLSNTSTAAITCKQKNGSADLQTLIKLDVRWFVADVNPSNEVIFCMQVLSLQLIFRIV